MYKCPKCGYDKELIMYINKAYFIDGKTGKPTGSKDICNSCTLMCSYCGYKDYIKEFMDNDSKE